MSEHRSSPRRPRAAARRCAAPDRAAGAARRPRRVDALEADRRRCERALLVGRRALRDRASGPARSAQLGPAGRRCGGRWRRRHRARPDRGPAPPPRRPRAPRVFARSSARSAPRRRPRYEVLRDSQPSGLLDRVATYGSWVRPSPWRPCLPLRERPVGERRDRAEAADHEVEDVVLVGQRQDLEDVADVVVGLDQPPEPEDEVEAAPEPPPSARVPGRRSRARAGRWPGR